MDAAAHGGFKPMLMMQVGDGYDAYFYSHGAREWRYDPGMFARRVVDGNRFTRREVSEGVARALIECSGGRFDGAPLVREWERRR